jgi:ubiquitin C-terminal hydrolase
MDVSRACAGCRRPVPKREYLRCMTCEAVYDLDCANVSYKFFNLMKKKDQWNCPECKSKKPKHGNVNTPVRPMATTDSSEELGSLHSDKGDHNVTLRKKMSRSSGDANSYEQELISPEPSSRGSYHIYVN